MFRCGLDDAEGAGGRDRPDEPESRGGEDSLELTQRPHHAAEEHRSGRVY